MPFAAYTLATNILILLILATLLYPFLMNGRKELIKIVSIYRPWALLCMSLNPLLIILAPFTTRAVLPIAPVSVGGALILLAFEIRSSRKKVPLAALWTSLALVLIAVALAEWRSDFGRFAPNNTWIIVSLVSAVAAWMCVEAILAYVVNRNQHYFFVILFAFITATALLVRTWMLAHTDHTFDTMMFFETDDLLLTRVAGAGGLLGISITLGQLYLDNEWKSEIASRKKAEQSMLMMLADLSLARDEETGNHITRTSEFVKIIAQSLRQRGLLEENERYDLVEIMAQAAPLHDIGKVGIPDHILKKPGKLDSEEWKIMMTHSSIGEEVLRAAAATQSEHTSYMDLLLKIAVDISGGHHENWDGSGYPRNLAGKNIPQAARIMALADVYDALISPRVYKAPWSHADATYEIVRLSGTKFEPSVVAAFLSLENEFRAISEKYKD